MTDVGILMGTLALYFIGVHFYAPRNLALLSSDFHPFLFISIFYSAYYGTKHAILACLILSGVYLGLVAIQIDFQAVESLFIFDHLKLPISITFSSLLVGEIRQRTWKSQWKTREKLIHSQKLEKELKKKVNLVESELTELKKRYATLTHSFDSNIEMFDNLEGKSFHEVIESCRYYLEKECQAHYVKFIPKDLSGAEKEEKQLLFQLQTEKEAYTLQDDLKRPESERLLIHVGVEMVYPLVFEGNVQGHFLLFDMPFLSLNIYNQKKIENIVHLASIALRNYFKRKDFEELSPLLPPYNILKKESFFEELSDFYNSIKQVCREKEKEVFYAKFQLDWQPHVSAEQKEKVYLVLSHLAKRQRQGIAPIGGSRNCEEFYFSFLSSKENKEKFAGRLIALFKTLVPDDLNSLLKMEHKVVHYSGAKRHNFHLKSV